MKKLFSKLKEKIKNSRVGKALVGVGTTVTAVCATAISSFAAEAEDTSSVVAGVKTVFDSVSGTFSFGNIVAMIGIAIAAAALLVLGWFGLRKVISMIKSALRGKLKV